MYACMWMHAYCIYSAYTAHIFFAQFRTCVKKTVCIGVVFVVCLPCGSWQLERADVWTAGRSPEKLVNVPSAIFVKTTSFLLACTVIYLFCQDSRSTTTYYYRRLSEDVYHCIFTVTARRMWDNNIMECLCAWQTDSRLRVAVLCTVICDCEHCISEFWSRSILMGALPVV